MFITSRFFTRSFDEVKADFSYYNEFWVNLMEAIKMVYECLILLHLVLTLVIINIIKVQNWLYEIIHSSSVILEISSKTCLASYYKSIEILSKKKMKLSSQNLTRTSRNASLWSVAMKCRTNEKHHSWNKIDYIQYILAKMSSSSPL